MAFCGVCREHGLRHWDIHLLCAVRAGYKMNLELLSTCIRPMICAPSGKKLVVCDLSAIENRVLMYLSGCESGLRVYEEGKDPYIDFGTRLYGVPYESISKTQRQICKPAVLGCGYGLGPGQEKTLANGEITLTGLRGYAENMGVKLTARESQDMVNTFRTSFYEVVKYWKYLEQAFHAAVSSGKRQQVGCLYFGISKDVLYIDLPSGRRIHYINPEAWNGAKGKEIRFAGLRGGFWGRISAWGGVLCENVVQAVARDVLVEGMFRAEEAGIPVIGHSHDELICEVDKNRVGAVEILESCMSKDIAWTPGLPLAAKGWEGERYAKG